MIIYSLVVRLYALAIRLAALRQEKATQWVKGRRDWRKQLANKLQPFGNRKKVWVHCASYGEFEQGRPLLEAIRKEHPEKVIVLTFFSPSGYEAFHTWNGADVIIYLPLDTKSNARDFLQLVQPSLAIFVKYEFWLHFLNSLNSNRIPSYLVSAVFKAHHPFFKWYGGIFRRSLSTFNTLFIQDEGSAALLNSIGITNHQIAGDTRFDRVISVKERFKPNEAVSTFANGKELLIAGSTWPRDEALLVDWFTSRENRNFRLVLVPHEVDPASIRQTEALLKKHSLTYLLYSEGKQDPRADVLVVDAMGLLSGLYYYASAAYIGGGFDSGLHNCLEASVYGKPVFFYNGGHHHKYNEAVELLHLKAAVAVSNADELNKAWQHYFSQDRNKDITKNILEAFFARHAGSTAKLMKAIRFDGSF